MRYTALILLFIIVNNLQAQQPVLMLPTGHGFSISDAAFIADGKYIITSAKWRNEGKLWNTEGLLLKNFDPAKTVFSSDGKRMATAQKDSVIISNAADNKLITSFRTKKNISRLSFIAGNNDLLLIRMGDSLKLYDLSKKTLSNAFGHGDKFAASNNGAFIVVYEEGPKSIPQLWNMQTGSPVAAITEGKINRHLPYYRTAQFTADGSRMMIITDWGPGKMLNDGFEYKTDNGYSTVSVWNTSTGELLYSLDGIKDYIRTAVIDQEQNIIITGGEDKKLRVWNIADGKLRYAVKTSAYIRSLALAADGSSFAAGDEEGKLYIHSLANGDLIRTIDAHAERINAIDYDPAGEKILTASSDKTAKLWELNTGSLVNTLKGRCMYINAIFSSPDQRYLGSVDTIIRVSVGKKQMAGLVNIALWDLNTGTMIGYHKARYPDEFSFTYIDPSGFNSGQFRYNTTFKGQAINWQGTIGKRLYSWSGSAGISQNGHSVFLGDKYQMVLVDSTEYLVFDADGHFDGTDKARKLLYFVDGLEVIDLQQLKDRLWVPGLAERIVKKEPLPAVEMNNELAASIPQTSMVQDDTAYYFKIVPGNAGVGRSLLYINGIETEAFEPSSLTKKQDNFELIVPKKKLQQYLAASSDNSIELKVYTAANDISSRGLTIKVKDSSKNKTVPNLYAVVIGVSDYKGKELKLNYASKDAVDFGGVLQRSASKLLGKEHVFVYNFNTTSNRFSYPDKANIRSVFDSIAEKATANDIMVVFFAGHGVTMGEQKQFYFLTAEASKDNVTDNNISNVGVSAAELMEWMRPQKIKAQKRILILDACNSGQAINQIVKIGDGNDYVAARDDDKAQQVKQIDKLNERSGLYILAASASNQSAYELQKYSQGVLTYSLLKVMKEQPEILEQNRYLNVSSWFNSSIKLVNDIVRENDLKQEPQLITTTNFNVGIVDEEVLAGITFPLEKKIFAASNFQNNDPAVMDDDLGFSKLVNQVFSRQSSGTTSPISYQPQAITNAWSLAGRYDVAGDKITVKVNVKFNGQAVQQFSVDGAKSNMAALAEAVVKRAVEVAGK